MGVAAPQLAVAVGAASYHRKERTNAMISTTRSTGRHAPLPGAGNHRRLGRGAGRHRALTHPGIYGAARACGSTRRKACGLSARIHRDRAAFVLRHPAIWWGDRHLRRAFRRAGGI